MTDIYLYQGENGAEIEVVDGVLQTTNGLESLVTLILTGGNDSDDGSPATAHLQWWGNDGEDPAKQYRSEFQALLNGAPLNSGRLDVLRTAAQNDLNKGLVATKISKSVEVLARLARPKTVELRINILLLNGEKTVIGLQVTQ